MAALYGRMRAYTKDGDPASGETTRCAGGELVSTLETWDGAIRTTLTEDGTFSVSIGQKGTPHSLVITGNVNDGDRHYEVNPGASELRRG
jgi:hypothetical protein